MANRLEVWGFDVNRKTVSFDVSDWPLIVFSGPDRAKSLHNLTTQDISGLSAGSAAEAFVTSPQGKTIGFFLIDVREHSILLRCAPGAESLALEHFGKFTIFDDANFEVVTPAFGQRLWLGVDAFETIAKHFVREKANVPKDVLEFDLPGVGAVTISRFDRLQVPGVWIIAPKERIDQAEAEIARIAEIIPEADQPALFERLRVLAAWPRFGVEIQADNLPQEIDRDATAISFRKGCYLGQETVARLDALGHVNRILRGFVLDSDHLPLDAASLANRPILNDAGQPMGEIRSAVEGENAQQAVGMALVRVKALDGALRVADMNEAALTLLPPAAFRERFAPVEVSLLAAVRA